MSVDKNALGEGDQLPGGIVDDKEEKLVEPTAPPAKGTVAYDTYKKAVDEAKIAKAKVAEFEKAKREADENKLKQDGDYKKILEQRDIELKEERAKLSAIETKLADGRKLNAFLGAVTGEVPKQYWSLIDLDQIVVNPDTGMPDESSVKLAADMFQQEYSAVVKKPTTSKLPMDAAKGGTGKLTYATWLTLPLEEKQARMKDVDKSTM